MPRLDAPRPEFRELAPWPPGTRFLDGRTERILQGRMPRRPDHPARTLTGSSASLAADSALAERSAGDLTADRLAKDAARQRAKRAGRKGVKKAGRGSAGRAKPGLPAPSPSSQ